MRAHCWVLVMANSRDVSEPFFIEPSTGKIFSKTQPDLGYKRIETVWNSTNYWVNVQPEVTIAVNRLLIH